MLSSNEIVLRELVVAADRGVRRWPGYAAVADLVGLAVSTVHDALRHARRNGFVEKRARGGFSVTDPDGILTLLKAQRDPSKDLIGWITDDQIAKISSELILSGPDAVIARLGGFNSVGSRGIRTVYVAADNSQDGLPKPTTAHAGTVRVLQADKRLAQLAGDGRLAPDATILADLFATPGWQADEFEHALKAARERERERLAV